MSPTICPVCGEPVPTGAKACPECGADERSGWNEEATRYDGLDLPEAAFGDTPVRSSRGGGLWVVVTIVLLVVVGLTFIFR